VFESPWRHHLL